MSEKIVIMGAGAIGSAVGRILIEVGQEVEFWDKDEALVPDQKELSVLVSEATVIFLCMNSWFLRSALQEIKTFLSSEVILVSLSKGLEKDTQKTMNEVFVEEVPNQTFALMAGPMLSDELNKQMKSCTAVASLDNKVVKKIESIFSKSILGVQGTDDVQGVALLSVLKNIYAMAMGMTEALELGNNFRGCVFSEACREMQEIVVKLGGKSETILSLAGLGDFAATGFSALSRNYQFGFEIVKDGQSSQNSEGVVALPSLLKKLDNEIGDYKILSALEQVVIEGQEAQGVFGRLF